MDEHALTVIKLLGPISAQDFAVELRVDEKVARGKIDRLRANGVAIWHDPESGKFWFRDDQEPGATPHHRWKRKFTVVVPR